MGARKQGRPRLHDDELRARLLAETLRIVAAEGPAAVSLRDVASRCATSTSAVYSLFGGKPGLLAVVHADVLTGFRATMQAVPATEEPLQDLVRLGHVYRDWAAQHPELRIVLATPLPGVDLDQTRWPTEPVEAAVRRSLTRGLLIGDPETLVDGYITTVHGFVDLEHRGIIPADRRERSFADLVEGWVRAHRGMTATRPQEP